MLRLKKAAPLAIFLISLCAVVGFVQAQTAATLECGDIIEGETTPNERVLTYAINARAGTILNGRVEPIGATTNIFVSFHDANDQRFQAFNSQGVGVAEEFQDFALGTSNPTLRVSGTYPDSTCTFGGCQDADYVGAFTIYLGCTLRDGTLILPGTQPPTSSPGGEEGSPQQVPQQTFSGFGMPVVGPVDFSAGIEIPLQAGQSQIAPIGGDVALYAYEASAGSSGTLSVTRMSGDISIGVAVIDRGNNEILFLGGMPSSDLLSVQLMFPTDGTYAIGIFRLDTPSRIGTSGAVQISIN